MPPAIIGGAIAAVGAIGASALSSKSNSKAIKTSTAAQQVSEAAQLGFQREARDENTANLSPWMARGNQAGDLMNAALGLGGGGITQFSNGYNDPSQHPQAALGAAGSTPASAAASAYELFKKSTGYATRFEEGQRALASNYFGGGVGQSGAAVKAALRFGDRTAAGEFGNWFGALGDQRNLGFAGASALAGVSQNFADRAGNISQNGADVASQAAIARAQNQGALWTGVAGAVGNVAGALSSYSPPTNYSGALASNVPHYGYG